MISYVTVCKAKNLKSLFFQSIIAYFVQLFLCMDLVSRSVQFNDQFRIGNIKINNVGIDHFLSMNGARDIFEKIIP